MAKITEMVQLTGRSGDPIWIAQDHVEAVRWDSELERSIIFTAGQNQFQVEETPEQIRAIVNAVPAPTEGDV